MGRDRIRRFCFTWNNYPQNAEEQLKQFYEDSQSNYMIVGKERGANGTPHLQGYIDLKGQMNFRTIKRLFPQMHIERAKGTALQNKTYCSKELDFFEMGTCPKPAGAASKESWTEILQAAESGNWDFLRTHHPRVWVMMSEKLISKRIPKSFMLDGDTNNEWWYGPTGTGKSRLAWDKYGKICFQKMLNKWWDGYDAQPVVIIEEWSPKNEVTASALKIWADRYPFTAQIKGGVLQKIRPLKIIVISNYRLTDCFPDTRDSEPLQRRFRQLEFPSQRNEAEQAAHEILEFIAAPHINDDIDSDEDLLSSLMPNQTQDTCEDPLAIPELPWLNTVTIDDFHRIVSGCS